MSVKMKPVKYKETALEYALTHHYKRDLIALIEKKKEWFLELIQLAIADKLPYSWRASWLLWSCIQKNDDRLRKHVVDIVAVLAQRSDPQQRELLIVLQYMPWPEEAIASLFDTCMQLWKTTHKNATLRFYAFKTLVQIIEKNPELKGELVYLKEERYYAGLSGKQIENLMKFLKITIEKTSKPRR